MLLKMVRLMNYPLRFTTLNMMKEICWLSVTRMRKSVDPLFKGQNEINIGGRTWIVTYSPTAKFYKHSLIWWTPIIFFLGLAISVVLFYLSLSQSS